MSDWRRFEQGEAIAADPSNLDNWAVYADWLQAIEPLLGERVALGVALARADSERIHLRARIERLERKHARELFGTTLAEALTFGTEKSGYSVLVERKLGMIVEATLSDHGGNLVEYDALLGALLDRPMSRLLLQLRISVHSTRPGFAKIVETFLAHRHPHLRCLMLGDPGLYSYSNPPWAKVPEFAALLERTPKLERLELYGPFQGEASHPFLRELEFGRETTSTTWTLPQWRLPALERLYVRGPGLLEWSLVDLPRLRHLTIELPSNVGDLVEDLARAPWLAQLDSLELRDTDMGNAGIGSFVAHARSFASIRNLSLVGHEADLDHVAALQAALPNIEVRNDPPEES